MRFTVDIKSSIDLYKSIIVDASSKEEAQAIAADAVARGVGDFDGSHTELVAEFKGIDDLVDLDTSEPDEWVVCQEAPPPSIAIELIRHLLLGFYDPNEPEDVRYASAIKKVMEDFEESMVEAGVDDYCFWGWIRDDANEFYSQVMAHLEEVKS